MDRRARCLALLVAVLWTAGWLPASAEALPQAFVLDADELDGAAAGATEGRAPDWTGTVDDGAVQNDTAAPIAAVVEIVAHARRAASVSPRRRGEPGLPRGPPSQA